MGVLMSGAIVITHDFIGATTIALDSIGATTIALGSIGATTITLDYSRFCRVRGLITLDFVGATIKHSQFSRVVATLLHQNHQNPQPQRGLRKLTYSLAIRIY